MELTGTQTIPAPRPAVWEALNDPAVLKRCLPGCESVERLDGDAFKVIVAAASATAPAFQRHAALTSAAPGPA